MQGENLRHKFCRTLMLLHSMHSLHSLQGKMNWMNGRDFEDDKKTSSQKRISGIETKESHFCLAASRRDAMCWCRCWWLWHEATSRLVFSFFKEKQDNIFIKSKSLRVWAELKTFKPLKTFFCNKKHSWKLAKHFSQVFQGQDSSTFKSHFQRRRSSFKNARGLLWQLST